MSHCVNIKASYVYIKSLTAEAAAALFECLHGRRRRRLLFDQLMLRDAIKWRVL